MIDSLLGRPLHMLGRVSLSSYFNYRLLFLPGLRGDLRHKIGRARARAAFWNARAKVPGYAEFLRQQDAWSPKRFEDVPPMHKKNYIQQFPLEALCQGGRLPTRDAVIDESSGSSGKATSWVRGGRERRAGRRLLQYAVRNTYGNDTFILLNAFALGPWATGMNVSMSLVERCVVKSIGPDRDKLVAALEDLGPNYRYLITGYPPFLKIFTDTADIDWDKYQILACVGGEGMSEALRASLNRCFNKTVSSFGASDLEINMAAESDFCIELRQLLGMHPDLARDLYGHEGVPMLFQYDPLSYWIESDDDRNLLFTINRLSNVSPRIRYNLFDRGIVRPIEEVMDILRDHRISLEHPPPVPLPVLFHWGRQGSAVAFYGANITPENLQNAILRIPELSAITEHFALHPYEDERADKRMDFWIEMKTGATAPEDLHALAERVIEEVADLNQDFREAIRMIGPRQRPSLEVFPYGESPFSGQDARIKRRYIV